MIDKKILNTSVKNALNEDDVFNDLSIRVLNKSALKKVEAKLTNNENLIISGIQWFNHSFKLLDKSIKIKWNFKDGDYIPSNQDLCVVSGNPKSILAAERTAINFLQFMSGISTKTNNYLKILNNKKINLLDTRKTLPNLRYEQKYATRIAGIKNHRFNLSDGLMLKDNHLKVLKGIDSIKYKHKKSKTYFFEIEVKKISEIEPALNLNPDILMFDNFSLNQIKKGIDIVNKRAKIEISGLKSEKDLKKLSKLKIDYISMGDLTKNIKSIDFSLNLI
ncbi:MAG: nicotinate-nucleotide diphosphorylase (carboxylating) [Gammaproteobacteria bacterium TMED222]|jgi:nicotinate-nucleotide pyrophosphorylase (carboxylating)|nr:MAG: nicotinate-nucleotide diphosphorylase (carboxylating) [Gammaproteobacteria bacterium TMED222]|tara:strand:- start:558 stop:1388 length:831 start_codon:yes stop_codon:yes gene_type:complete